MRWGCILRMYYLCFMHGSPDCPKTPQNAFKMDLYRHSRSNFLNCRLDFVHQCLNWKFPTCGKPIVWKVLSLIPCIRIQTARESRGRSLLSINPIFQTHISQYLQPRLLPSKSPSAGLLLYSKVWLKKCMILLLAFEQMIAREYHKMLLLWTFFDVQSLVSP